MIQANNNTNIKVSILLTICEEYPRVVSLHIRPVKRTVFPCLDAIMAICLCVFVDFEDRRMQQHYLPLLSRIPKFPIQSHHDMLLICLSQCCAEETGGFSLQIASYAAIILHVMTAWWHVVDVFVLLLRTGRHITGQWIPLTKGQNADSICMSQWPLSWRHGDVLLMCLLRSCWGQETGSLQCSIYYVVAASCKWATAFRMHSS